MEIKNISEKIFKTSPNKIENAGLHTNPFGVSFKGNIITADVFETREKSEKISFGQNIAKGISRVKSRMEASALVGSLNSMGQAFSARMNSIANFGRRIADNTTRVWTNTRECISNGINFIKENNLKIDLNIVKNRKGKSVEGLARTFAELVDYKEIDELLEGIAV